MKQRNMKDFFSKSKIQIASKQYKDDYNKDIASKQNLNNEITQKKDDISSKQQMKQGNNNIYSSISSLQSSQSQQLQLIIPNQKNMLGENSFIDPLAIELSQGCRKSQRLSQRQSKNSVSSNDEEDHAKKKKEIRKKKLYDSDPDDDEEDDQVEEKQFQDEKLQKKCFRQDSDYNPDKERKVINKKISKKLKIKKKNSKRKAVKAKNILQNLDDFTDNDIAQDQLSLDQIDPKRPSRLKKFKPKNNSGFENLMCNAKTSVKELVNLREQLLILQNILQDQYFALHCGDNQNDFFKQKIKSAENLIPEYCIPINANVKNFDFKNFSKLIKSIKGRSFDVIMMDPPWELSSAQPTRGVAIGYDTMTDLDIQKMEVKQLSDAGFIFIWVINAKYQFGLQLLETWGYEFCTVINWMKQTKMGGIAKGHGFYLQHAKESCLVGIKNKDKIAVQVKPQLGHDVLFSRRRGQSQKPNDIYQTIEKVMPDAFCLQIFGRRNNLRNFWVTIGNEI